MILFGNSGVAFNIVSYGEKIRFCSVADSSILSQDDMEGFNEAFYEEIDLLKKSIVV
jgi:hypothetical protein